MFGVRKILILICLSSPAAQADAPWLPQWMAIWEPPSAVIVAEPHVVRVAADGSSFVALETFDGDSRSAIARFDANGKLAWIRNGPRLEFAALEFTGTERIALLGQAKNIVLRIFDTTTGNLIWARESSAGNLWIDRAETKRLAIAPNGDFLIRASDGADFIVVRFDANGNPLPEWRLPLGGKFARASEIVALPDGGAIVTGGGDSIGGGYVTVRFDAQGVVQFSDRELGDLGNPLGPSRVVMDEAGNFLIAASPESFFGAPMAQVWKISADGHRQWTRRLPDPTDDRFGVQLGGMILAGTDSGGDIWIAATDTDERLKLLRLDGETGVVETQSRSIARGMPVNIARMPNQRVLIIGNDMSPWPENRSRGQVAEFDGNGQPCRAIINHPALIAISVDRSDHGWTLLGNGRWGSDLQGDIVALRYDATGPCDPADTLFSNGFE